MPVNEYSLTFDGHNFTYEHVHAMIDNVDRVFVYDSEGNGVGVAVIDHNTENAQVNLPDGDSQSINFWDVEDNHEAAAIRVATVAYY